MPDKFAENESKPNDSLSSEPYKLVYSTQRAQGLCAFGILAVIVAGMFFVITVFVQLDEVEGRDWPLYKLCRDYGWTVALLGIILAGFDLATCTRRKVGGIVIIGLIASFIWYAQPHLYR